MINSGVLYWHRSIEWSEDMPAEYLTPKALGYDKYLFRAAEYEDLKGTSGWIFAISVTEAGKLPRRGWWGGRVDICLHVRAPQDFEGPIHWVAKNPHLKLGICGYLA